MKNLLTFRTPHFICRALGSAKTASFYAVCLFLLSGVAQHANAAPDPARSFNVNFYQFTPSVGPPEDPATLEGPAGGLGQKWNQFNAISGTNLTTASGAPSTFGFTTTANQGRSGENSPLKILKAGISIGVRGTDYTLTLKNLAPGGYYDVWIASGMVDSRPGERDSGTWSTTNPTVTVGPQPINCLKSTSSTWVEGNNYVVFKSVQANPSGQIEFLADPSDAGEVDDNAYVMHLNGFQVTPAPPAGMISFGVPGAAGVINPTAKTISLQVPFGTNLASLAPTFILPSGTCNQKSGAPPSPNFAASKSARYVVTDSTTTPNTVYNYTVTVSVAPPSSACAILAADFGTLGTAVIDESAGTVVLTVPKGQPVTSLAPKFTLSANATLKPASGSARDFTKAAVYRVTAENGTTFKDYKVSVITYANWTHSGSFFILTTPDGANMAASASVSDFPILIRLKSSNFNFAEAQSDGRDLRFTNAAGASLPYQIEQWDPTGGSAAVWVKIPTITGNTTQEIKMYWGNSGVAAISSGASVFNPTNGYASVLHMGETLADEVVAKPPTNVNTTAADGLIGKGRTFAAGQGIACGKTITGLPSGDGPFSTGVWMRTSTPSTVLGWGFSTGQSKVVMQLASPPRIGMDCWFGAAGVTGKAPIPPSVWNYVVHTYQSGSAKLYVNGVLDAANIGGAPMRIPPIGIFQIGGFGAYNFVGDMDEVRISKVVRSPEWVKLEYENQKPVQTLVGGIVSSGNAFAVTPSSVKIKESSSTTLTAQAGGAQKVYWIYKKDGKETVLATDQLTLNYTAPRVSNDDSAVIQFKAVFAAGTRTIDVPLTVLNSVPDPVFTLSSSVPQWDGRQTMTVTANVPNLAAMQAAGFGNLNYKWSVSGVAVTKQTSDGTLTLTRSQGSGPMIVSLTMNNGGTPVSQSATITVREPATDPWVQRTPDANEKSVDKQFFARDPATNLGKLFYCGTQADATDVYLKVFTTDTGSDVPYSTLRQKLVNGAYSFAAPIAAGKVTYKITFGTTKTGVDTAPLATVNDLVCGDAFIIEGQSNALALNNSAPPDTTTNKWVRTYGAGWCYAIKKGGNGELGIWGWALANRLEAKNKMPICIINGAKGGTRIDLHRPNPEGHALPGTLYSIYAGLYNRVVAAKLTHGIRGLLWHQGENDQGAEGPDGDYDYKFYQQYFVDISAAWKQDFPNLRNYYLFQIWPGACGDTSRNDQLREVQRTLPRLYSHMQCMSTLGIVPGSACHYDEPGYQVFSDLIGPLIEKDAYGVVPSKPITAPDLQRAYFTTSAKNEIALEFGQEMAWNELAPTMLFLADTNGAPAGIVSSGSATGNILKLKVPAGSSATSITYVKGLVPWKQTSLLYGTNKIAALTFADVPIEPPPVSPNK